jgi:hypothetical protein
MLLSSETGILTAAATKINFRGRSGEAKPKSAQQYDFQGKSGGAKTKSTQQYDFRGGIEGQA